MPDEINLKLDGQVIVERMRKINRRTRNIELNTEDISRLLYASKALCKKIINLPITDEFVMKNIKHDCEELFEKIEEFEVQ